MKTVVEILLKNIKLKKTSIIPRIIYKFKVTTIKKLCFDLERYSAIKTVVQTKKKESCKQYNKCEQILIWYKLMHLELDSYVKKKIWH